MCDNCYINAHKHKRHVWEPLIVMCSECETYACRWWCEECGDPFCTPCFERTHSRGHRAIHKVQSRPYYLISMKKRDDEIELQRKLQDEKKRALELQKKLNNAKAIKAAIKLQSAWRSKVARRVGQEHMRAERLWRRAEASRKIREEELRKDFKYRVKKLKQNFVNGLNVALHESSNKERLPGTVTLKPQRARVKCSDDLSDLLKSGDCLMLKGVQNIVKIKRVKRRLRKKKNDPAWSEVFLTRPWDGIFDSKKINAKNVETDEDGDVKKITNIVAFKMPSMNMKQQFVASAVRTVGGTMDSLSSTFG